MQSDAQPEHHNLAHPDLTSIDLEHLAMFPLPNAVFFPNTSLPLHIFEPRYRDMMRDAIEHGMPIVVVRMKEPRVYNDQGMPEFHEVGGLGFLSQHQELPDGRFNVLLEGVARVRIQEELVTDRSYRMGRGALVEEIALAPGKAPDMMAMLRGCVMGLQTHYVRLAEAIARIMNQVEEPGAIADIIASIIITDPSHRQDLLDELRVEARFDAIVDRLTQLLLNSPEQADNGPAN